MNIVKSSRSFYTKSCSPAKLYLVLSLVSILGILVQNLYEANKYCIGMYSCNINFPNILLFLLKVVYTIIWVLIIDSLCKNKFTTLAWFLVLFPIILMFMLIGMFLFLRINK